MYYSESGEELKKFNTRDGMGIKLLQRAGIITAIVTQERTKLVARRGEKLMIPEVHQGVMDKLALVREMVERLGAFHGRSGLHWRRRERCRHLEGGRVLRHACGWYASSR